jgi:hypothetical protein
LKPGTVELFPLAHDRKEVRVPGWCTYTDGFDSPEIEVFCGGLNSKTPTAAAVWRQGHLLHFGFDVSPAEITANGQALLVNAIAYIARFPDDRPIPRTPSPFEGVSAVLRTRAARGLRDKDPNSAWMAYYFAARARAAGRANDLKAFRAWFKENQDFLHAEAGTGKLTVDEEAKAFGVPPHTPEFFPKAIAALGGSGEEAARAGRLLSRYAPEGPGRAADASAWRAWWREHQPYVFFSEAGWYRWYVDPLAKKRAVPTARLRSAARATKP